MKLDKIHPLNAIMTSVHKVFEGRTLDVLGARFVLLEYCPLSLPRRHAHV